MRISGRVCILFLVVIASWFLFNECAFSYPTIYPTGTTIYKPNKSYIGYTLYSEPNGHRALLIKMNGTVVNVWRSPSPDFQISYAEPTANGTLLVALKRESDLYAAALMELDWESKPLWVYFLDAPNSWMHHDFERLENGNTLVLCQRFRYIPEISDKQIIDDYILEIDENGDVLNEWYTSDHFDEFGFTPFQKLQIRERGWDWSHSNSIMSLPENDLNDPRFRKGNILVSQRYTNTIFVIDWPSGRIVWKTGLESKLTIGQHDVKMIPQSLPGAGNIICFDNGSSSGAGGVPYAEITRAYSRVIEIEPVSKSVVWKYTADQSGLMIHTFFSAAMGGVQRLPNGNTLITESMAGRLFEVTPEGEIVWEYIAPLYPPVEGEQDLRRNTCYRAFRLDSSWPGIP